MLILTADLDANLILLKADPVHLIGVFLMFIVIAVKSPKICTVK